MHCNYDITWGDIANENEVTMWLSHDSSSEYALEFIMNQSITELLCLKQQKQRFSRSTAS
jgi:hypothetical protein